MSISDAKLTSKIITESESILVQVIETFSSLPFCVEKIREFSSSFKNIFCAEINSFPY